MFYKNVLFTVTQFWFGFVNAFSGQTLYEPFLYQGYNLVFTAFPIIWFAVYDMQYPKEELITNPKLYSIGLNNECFSTTAFFMMIFSGIFNGLALDFFCFICQDGYIVSDRAKNQDFWIDGTMAYAATVIVVNIAIL
jgi:phospholipid-transporting ATPase